MFGRALDATLEKHQGTEWLWIAPMPTQQVEPKRKTYGQQTAKKPWRKKTHLQLSFADAEVLTQSGIERPIGAQQEVVKPRALGFASQSLYVVCYLLPILSAGILRGSFNGFTSFYVQQQRGPIKNGFDLLRMKHVEQDEFTATVTKRLHCFYDFIRVFIEIGDQNGNAPLFDEPLQLKERANKIGAFPESCMIDAMQQAHELALTRRRRHKIRNVISEYNQAGPIALQVAQVNEC